MEINLIAKFLHNKTKGYELRANKYSVFFYIFINEMIIAFRNINPIYFMEIIADKIEALLPKKKLDIFGKNSLLHNTFPYYLLASMILLGHFGEGENVFMFIFVIYTVLPLLDQFLSFDFRNPNEQERKSLQKRDFYFRLVLYITIILDWSMFFRVLKVFSQIEITPMSLVHIAATIFLFSNLESVQFAIAHQVFHKPGLFHKYLGTIHMSKNLYMHFTYQHLYGHHRRVATPQDTGSAPKGMNVYRFFVRTLIGSWKSVYKMQKYEQKRPFYKNYAILSLVCSVIFTSLIFKFYGIQGGIFYLCQTLGSIFYLQTINFIEHYGLSREKKGGEYQKVTIRHSWNAPHRFTNYLLFKLQRHSDHHQNSLKPYQTLVSLDESPHLPHGYTVCIFLALFPSEWAKIMDPLVDEYKIIKFGNINGQVMKKAIKQTRKFIIKLGIFTTSLYLWSLTW